IITQSEDKPHTILFTPQGRKLNQNIVNKYSNSKNLILLCGHYEGVDERIRQALVDDELSIGDYVLTGGELPAMIFIDAVSRLLTGVLGDERSLEDDSFYQGILSYPQYTRPREFKGQTVPEVLLSGNHGKIRLWRKKQALKRTLERRPDLLKDRQLTSEEKDLLLEIKHEMERG
ncbi:MAG: tRNA (guanosine(37)-N1)-methyltransferase TrmD, partial [Halanaerobiales bacterium]